MLMDLIGCPSEKAIGFPKEKDYIVVNRASGWKFMDKIQQMVSIEV